jgi:hypothetical protein
MNIEYVAMALLLGFLYFRYKTGIQIYGVFGGTVALFLAVSFVASSTMIAIIFGLFAIYLFYDSIFK